MVTIRGVALRFQNIAATHCVIAVSSKVRLIKFVVAFETVTDVPEVLPYCVFSAAELSS